MSDPSGAGPNDVLLTPAEVAERFGVTVQTLRLWAVHDKIPWYRTKGGHRRYRASDVERLLRPIRARPE